MFVVTTAEDQAVIGNVEAILLPLSTSSRMISEMIHDSIFAIGTSVSSSKPFFNAFIMKSV